MHGLEFFRQIRLFDEVGVHLVLQITFDTRERVDITVTDQRERKAFGASAARATNAVNIVFRIIRELEVDDHVDTFDVEAARGYVADMLRTSPLGLKLTKDCLNHAVDAGSLEGAIAIEDRNQILCVQSPNFSEGVAAFLEKRPAAWVPRDD